MIFARGDHGDDQFLLIGLSRLNIAKLQAGQPIVITRDSHGEAIPEHWKIAIMAGETESVMAAELKEMGMLGAGTKIKGHPGL